MVWPSMLKYGAHGSIIGWGISHVEFIRAKSTRFPLGGPSISGWEIRADKSKISFGQTFL